MLENTRVLLEILLPDTLPQRIAIYAIAIGFSLLAASVWMVAS